MPLIGLPEYFGRKKKDLFTIVVDKIIHKATHWTSRFLSSAGKQVLLKSVLAAMPSYTMSCFKIPISLCKRIQSALTRFWWDDKPGKRKISWVAWDKLILPKSLGGLGFRDIECFNVSLLAKLSWKILMEPASLLSRVLLGKYCVTESFMECSAPRVCSHGWKGILEGRNLLRLGLGWVVGNGNKINIWSDFWLSHSAPVAPMGPPNANSQHLQVSSLIHRLSHTWNVAAIRRLIPDYEASIRQIYLSSHHASDTLVWLPEKSGTYSTRSGYAIAKVQQQQQFLDHFKWKQLIWNLKTSPKLRCFLWKIKRKALPVGSNLAVRGVSVSLTCKRCGLEETELHILLTCNFAISVWDIIPAIHKPHTIADITLDLFFSCAPRMTVLPPLGITSPLHPWVSWQLWKARNALVFEQRHISAVEVASKAISEAQEWQNAQPCLSPSPPTITTRLVAPPVTSSTLGFSDAAWQAETLRCGVGWCFLDPGGETTAQGSATHLHIPSALLGEAIALKTAIEAAQSLELDHLTVCSDSQSLV